VLKTICLLSVLNYYDRVEGQLSSNVSLLYSQCGLCDVVPWSVSSLVAGGVIHNGLHVSHVSGKIIIIPHSGA